MNGALNEERHSRNFNPRGDFNGRRRLQWTTFASRTSDPGKVKGLRTISTSATHTTSATRTAILRHYKKCGDNITGESVNGALDSEWQSET